MQSKIHQRSQYMQRPCSKKKTSLSLFNQKIIPSHTRQIKHTHIRKPFHRIVPERGVFHVFVFRRRWWCIYRQRSCHSYEEGGGDFHRVKWDVKSRSPSATDPTNVVLLHMKRQKILNQLLQRTPPHHIQSESNSLLEKWHKRDELNLFNTEKDIELTPTGRTRLNKSIQKWSLIYLHYSQAVFSFLWNTKEDWTWWWWVKEK